MNSIKIKNITQIDPDLIARLPHGPGVYIFRGETALPLYIGKSLDIRNRVLSHIRSDEKSRMVTQARHVDYIETTGDIGAQLLEAHLIKDYKPLYNIRLRRVKKLYSIRLTRHSDYCFPQIVSSQDVTMGGVDGLYGLFRSARSVRSKLEEIAKNHQLCHGLLGLEKINKRGCFGFQIKQCLGACVGQEDTKRHDERLIAGLDELKIHIWPYDGAIDLVEERDGWVQKHRVNQWRYIGTWCSKENRFKESSENGFDLDIYKILIKPIMFHAEQSVIQTIEAG